MTTTLSQELIRLCALRSLLALDGFPSRSTALASALPSDGVGYVRLLSACHRASLSYSRMASTSSIYDRMAASIGILWLDGVEHHRLMPRRRGILSTRSAAPDMVDLRPGGVEHQRFTIRCYRKASICDRMLSENLFACRRPGKLWFGFDGHDGKAHREFAQNIGMQLWFWF